MGSAAGWWHSSHNVCPYSWGLTGTTGGSCTLKCRVWVWKWLTVQTSQVQKGWGCWRQMKGCTLTPAVRAPLSSLLTDQHPTPPLLLR